MGKQRDLSLETYIEETTKNINEDRAMAKTLLVDMMADMKVSPADRREMGPIAAKFIETLQRSNEQLVKLSAILQRQKTTQTGLTADDKVRIIKLLEQVDDKLEYDYPNQKLQIYMIIMFSNFIGEGIYLDLDEDYVNSIINVLLQTNIIDVLFTLL